jgi:uncharacterized membrane protein YfcA
MHDTIVFLVAAIAGAVASLTGFGIGSLLTPLLALSLGTRLAVAAVSVPHVVGTALRFWRLRVPADRGVLWSFGLASAAGGLLGALLHGWAENPWLAMVFGGLLLFVGVSEWLGWSERIRFTGARASVAGALSGFFGGLVGNQGGIRSAALLGFDLKRETFVATATAIGLIVDSARMPVYVWGQHDALMTHRVTIAIATAGVVMGTLAGGRVLSLIPEPRFRRVVAAVLGLLGTAMASRGVVDAWP